MFHYDHGQREKHFHRFHVADGRGREVAFRAEVCPVIFRPVRDGETGGRPAPHGLDPREVGWAVVVHKMRGTKTINRARPVYFATRAEAEAYIAHRIRSARGHYSFWFAEGRRG